MRSANAPAISSAPTVIQASANFGNFLGGNGADPVLFEVDARPSAGTVNAIYGVTDGSGYGVFGAGGFGVNGTGESVGVFGSGPIGVIGGGTTTGVSGIGNTSGVLGTSLNASGVGVRGDIPNSTNAASTIAVYGANLSSSDGGAPGAGGFGCYGVSLKGHGLVGATGTAGGGAVVGATNGVSGAWAGIFYGPVAITGLKSAAVAHPDGTHRLLYCVESPESWFEDFGEGQLTDGQRRYDRPGVRGGRGDAATTTSSSPTMPCSISR